MTAFYLRYMDLKFNTTLNACGVIAGVQLLHTMTTRSNDKKMLNLSQHAKTITFGFMQKLTMTGDAVSQAGTPSRSNRYKTKQQVEVFTRFQLRETFRCILEWMDSNFAKTLLAVESIVEELKERLFVLNRELV